MKRFAILATILIYAHADSMERVVAERFLTEGINTFHGHPITAENIIYSSQILDNPEIIAWLKKHNELLILLNTPQFDVANRKAIRAERNELLKKEGLENLSYHSYVIPIMHEGKAIAFVKFSGLMTRLNNLFMSKSTRGGIWSEQDLTKYTQNEIDHISANPLTYQHISRLAYWLRLKELEEQGLLELVKFPAIYLVHLDTKPLDSNDSNYIIVEQAINDGKRLDDKSAIEQLTFQHIFELVQTIKYAGIWDLGGVNMLLKDGTLYLIDIEQPDNSSQSDFFNKNIEKYDWNISHGIRELVKTFGKESKQYDYLKMIVLGDSYINSTKYFKTKIKPLFVENDEYKI